MPKKIVVTGSNGFLGRNLLKMGLELGFKVMGVVRSNSAAKVVKNIGAEFIVVDDYQKEILIPEFKNKDAVLHFIGITGGSKQKFKEINVDLSLKIARFSAESGVSRFILPTGLGVSEYGKKAWANNNYFWSKKEIEKSLFSSDINYVIFRPSYILGPDDELIPYLVEDILNGEVKIIGEGDTPMQPIYVNDVARCFLYVANGLGPSRYIYDLVGDKILTMNKLVSLTRETMEKILDKKISYTTKYIDVQNAAKEMNMYPEDVDVSQCDYIGDNSSLKSQLKIKLTPIEKAVEHSVKHKLKELGELNE